MSATNATPIRLPLPGTAVDDITTYQGSLTESEQGDLVVAAVAFDLTGWPDHAGTAHHRANDADLETEALQQQAARHFEPTGFVPQLGALARFLDELGYGMTLDFVDVATGKRSGRLPIPGH